MCTIISIAFLKIKSITEGGDCVKEPSVFKFLFRLVVKIFKIMSNLNYCMYLFLNFANGNNKYVVGKFVPPFNLFLIST